MKSQTSGRTASVKASALHTVAVLEATKGAIVLLLGCGVLDLSHKNLDDVAERLTEVLHVSSDGKLSKLFVELASHDTDGTLRVLALGAPAYAAARSIVAYGL